jgi:hypothetical protein
MERSSWQAQSQWGKLTNDDLDVIKGRRTELKAFKHYGYAKDKLSPKWMPDQQTLALCRDLKRLV